MTKFSDWLKTASDNDKMLFVTGMTDAPSDDGEGGEAESRDEDDEGEGQRNWEKWDEEHKLLHPPHPPRSKEELKRIYGLSPKGREGFEQFKTGVDEKGQDTYDMDAYRKAADAWDAKMKRALSMGDLSDVEAKSIGFYQGGGEPWEPLPHDLYHVTTNATAVEKSGRLKTRDELEMGRGHGLGGGSSDTISYTEKPETAQTIKDAMHEARSVAAGETTVKDLVERARKGDKGSTPFLADIVKGWGGPGSFDNWKDGDPLPGGLQALIDGKEVQSAIGTTTKEMNKENPSPTTPWEPAPFANSWKGGDGQMRYTHYQRDMTPSEKQDDALDFYKKFSLWRSYHGGPEDPLFFLTDAQALAAVKPEDIKVVHVQPKPRAQGFQLSALGEWRTHTGDNVDIVGTRWWAQTLLRRNGIEPGVAEFRDWASWDAAHEAHGRALRAHAKFLAHPSQTANRTSATAAHEYAAHVIGKLHPDADAQRAAEMHKATADALSEGRDADARRLADEADYAFRRYRLTQSHTRDWATWDAEHRVWSPRQIKDKHDPGGKHPFRDYLSDDKGQAVKEAMDRWRSSFINSSNMRAYAEGRKMAPGVNDLQTKFDTDVLHHAIAESRPLGQPSYRIEPGAAPKVGDILDRPIAAVATRRAEAEQFKSTQIVPEAGSHLLRFSPETQGLSYPDGRESIVSGQFRVASIDPDGTVNVEPVGHTRDWAKWDAEHPYVPHPRPKGAIEESAHRPTEEGPIAEAADHIEENERRFREAGGTIEHLNGRDDADRLREIDRTELVELRQRLERANGGPLPELAQKGFQLAHIAASFGRKDPNATIRIARTKGGDIAAIMADGPRGSGTGLHHHISFAGSTRIAHGAGSALLSEAMHDAAAERQRVALVPYDAEAALYWTHQLGAHMDPFGDMGWTPEEVDQLAKAA